MRNVVLLTVSVVVVFGVYYGGRATAKVVSQYYPTCRTFEFPDGQRITGWHAVFGNDHHLVQLRTGEYATFEVFSAIHPADKEVDCDFDYVRPTIQRG